jgi:hypothetical protein
MKYLSRNALVLTLVAIAVVASAAVTQVAQQSTASASTGDQKWIVYLDRDNNVWASRTDGSEANQLTTGGGFSEVQMTTDGSRIIATGPLDGGSGVFLMSPNPDFDTRSMAPGRTPAWSPDNSRLSFRDGNTVHIFDREGNYIRSTEAPAHVMEWSPDGRHIGFARNIMDPYSSGCPVRQLGWIDANTGTVEIAGPMIGEFTWNGDGTGLLHVSSADGNLRSHSIQNDSSELVSNQRISPCNAPFFSTADGQRIVAGRWSGEGSASLIVIDQRTREDQVYENVPVSYPATRLPSAYISGDSSGRFVYLGRSFPTDVHRLDLETGQIDPILTNDWRRIVDFSADGGYFALLNVPTGQPLEMTVHGREGSDRTMENVGWLNWQPSPLNTAAHSAWHQTWQREDRPVSAGESRTWLWGPEFFDARVELYDQSPGGYRAVRYFDKSRMEITNPAGDRDSEWYVTNGLLVVELITGQMQVGDDRFVERNPAQVPVAGDQDDPNSPTYATLQDLLHAPPIDPGQEITATLDADGNIGDGGPGEVFAEEYVDATNHTVADVFWEYLNSTGAIWDGQQIAEGQLFQPTFFATGFPITEAYWTEVRVGGDERDVLLQCFERRCLTYTPDNPEGWRVEMGNVGRHYHDWRYQ